LSRGLTPDAGNTRSIVGGSGAGYNGLVGLANPLAGAACVAMRSGGKNAQARTVRVSAFLRGDRTMNLLKGRKGLGLSLASSFAILSPLAALVTAAEGPWSVTSPDGQTTVTLTLTAPAGEADYPADRVRLYYRVERGRGEAKTVVLPWSPLGIERDDQPFVDSLRLTGAGPLQTIDETYRTLHGKRSLRRSWSQQQSFVLQNPAGAKVQVTFRVANDGVAFRYEFPEQDDLRRTVVSEATGFRVPEGALAWIQPYQEPSQYTPAYEEYFQNGIPAGTAAPGEAGWCLPALFQTPRGKHWLLLAEAAVDATYCGTRLGAKAPHGVYRIRFPQAGEGHGVGEVCPQSTLPWQTPWRVILVADTLAEIVESTFVEDLNPPSAVAGAAWIKPGRVAWSWWSDHDSSRDFGKLREFVDLAAEMGWEYSLVDANWTLMDGGDVRQLARYAASKGVGLLLWYNSGGPHNIVTEKPRGCLDQAEVRRFEFQLLKDWGVKGIKVDFFQSDKQHLMQLYHDILRDAAEFQLLINFHGCTMPRGWSRTWPHLLSMEAVRGAENYTFAPEYPEKAPWHNTILCFTRNVVGPMDYTPVAFTNGGHAPRTTVAHELALSVVFESALMHFADRASAYRQLPPAPLQWLKTIPVAWDETRLLGGYPGKWLAVARRKGSTWYLGGINGQEQPQAVELDWRFLADGHYTLGLIEDGAQARSFAARELPIRTDQPLEIRLLPRGGFTGQIRLPTGP